MRGKRKNVCKKLALIVIAALSVSFVGCAKETATTDAIISTEKRAGTEVVDETKTGDTGEVNSTESMIATETEELAASETESEEISTEVAEKERVKVKGIYVTGPKAGSAGMEDLITLLDETELNTMVIDIKDDSGNITYDMDLDVVQESGACVRYIRDMEGLMTNLKEHNIYTIARIVCFKDDFLAKSKPNLALKTANGTAVTDANGIMWVNPYSKEVWEYLTQIANEALRIGFDEVQFDYVRFPVGNVANAAEYGVDMVTYPKEEAIWGFLTYVKEQLKEDAIVGADLFGTVIGSEIDKERVGQDYVSLGSTVDVLCPMVYPSHYANGVFGLAVPDAYPYDTIHAALSASVEQLSPIFEDKRAVVRPWLQSFTATWVDGHISYNGEQIRAQIQATYDVGYDEWILWNASNRYSKDGLLEAEESE